jgi:hypothetical protein
MTSTDLARSLAIPLDTPGCREEVVVISAQRSGKEFNDLGGVERRCLWPLPDSGKRGAELFTAALLRALAPRLESLWVDHDGKWWVSLHRTDGHGTKWLDQYGGDTEVEALYAAWKEQK